MSVETPQPEMTPAECLISDCTTKLLDSDGPSLAALLNAIGPEAARKARTAALFDWDGPTKAFLKKSRPAIYAALVTAAQWVFSYAQQVPLACTFVLVYVLTQGLVTLEAFAETVDEMAGRLNVLRYTVAVHTLCDEDWKWRSGIEIKDPRRFTGLDVARRLVEWDGESGRGSKESSARWKIMSDILNPERPDP